MKRLLLATVVTLLIPAAPHRGRRVGVLLRRSQGRWVAGGRDVVEAGELLKTAGIGP